MFQERLQNEDYQCDCDPPGQPRTQFMAGQETLPNLTHAQLIDVMKLDRQSKRKFLHLFDTVLCDLDGVLWHPEGHYEGTVEVINGMQAKGRKVIFVSNITTMTRSECVEKAQSHGFRVDSDDQMLTAGYCTAEYLKEIFFTKKTAYLIGCRALHKELIMAGMKTVGQGLVPIKQDYRDSLRKFRYDPKVCAVIVGFDPYFSFEKMMAACTYLRDPSVLFIATSLDEQFPTNSGLVVLPGTGAMVAAIAAASGRKPDHIMGKPGKYMCKLLIERHKIVPQKCLMIGDRAGTDVLFGKNCGTQTLLILAGTTSLEQCITWRNSPKHDLHNLVPDFYMFKLGDLAPYIDDITAPEDEGYSLIHNDDEDSVPGAEVHYESIY